MANPDAIAADLCLSGRFIPVDYSDDEFHRHLYSFLENNVLPAAPPNKCPPLSLLAYSARNILQPTFVIEQIPDLLVLIANIDVWRTKAVQKTANILKWNRIYEGSPSEGVHTLSEEQRMYLEVLVRPKKVSALRRMYREIVHACAKFDIHHALDTDGPVMDLLYMYFPDVLVQVQEDRQERTQEEYLFHYGLTKEERDEDRNLAVECLKLVRDVGLWKRDREAYCSTIGVPVESSFIALFPRQITENVIATSAEYYMSQVERLFQALDGIFGESSAAIELKQEDS
ncbi:hypothetical protein OBBRIDRAFT_793572 [Obba rivulosa]|uniref:Uncharacterized protein n=1 Tax=Obba rivulosa TaxID=1052685 RepID=A0A8E2B0X1_9APHY|nr:hypothetical protein OBBRIDRAFT_793572 [Obba rivulosa]